MSPSDDGFSGKTLVTRQAPLEQYEPALRVRLSIHCQAPRHRWLKPPARYLTMIVPNEEGEPEFVSHCRACARVICRDIGQPWPPPTHQDMRLMTETLQVMDTIFSDPDTFARKAAAFGAELTAGLRALMDVSKEAPIAIDKQEDKDAPLDPR